MKKYMIYLIALMLCVVPFVFANPRVNFTTGTLANNSLVKQTTITLNISTNESIQGNVTFYLYTASGLVNASINSTTNQTNITFRNLADNTYYYNATIQDILGASNSTMTYYSRLDNTAPTFSLVSPVQDGIYSVDLLIRFNATDLSNTSYLWYNNGTANRTYTAAETMPYTVGTHTFTFYANDTLTNKGSSSITFRVVEDLTANTACLGIFDTFSDSIVLMSIAFIVIMAIMITGIMQLTGGSIDIKSGIAALIVSALFTLIGYVIVAKISGIIC